MKISARKNNQNFYSPLPVFGQLLNLINQVNLEPVFRKHLSDKHCKRFSTKDHLITMLVAVITRTASIRALCHHFMAHFKSLYHIGLSAAPKRSTISYANQHRDSKVFEETYHKLYQTYFNEILDSLHSPILKGLSKPVKIIDSTTIGLVHSVMRNTGRQPIEGKKKGGIKLHAEIEQGLPLPIIHYMSEGIMNDREGLRKYSFKKDTIYVMDKGYQDFEMFDQMQSEGVYFVTRIKRNVTYETIEELDIPDTADNGIIKDEVIEKETNSGKKLILRRVAYWDEEHKITYEFITNLMEIEVDYIPLLYKHRWKIELTFKQLKQNFMLGYYLGDNENAIKIQILSCLIANLLLMVVYSRVRKKRKQIAFSNVVNFVRNAIHSYTDLIKMLVHPIHEIESILREMMFKRRGEMEGQLSLEFVY